MIVLAVPGLRADDLVRAELPTLQALSARGAVGWMNARTARVPGRRGNPPEAAWLTLGAGARAAAGPYARTPEAPEALAKLAVENARLDHPVPVGALGDLLHAAGLRTAVIGAEDDIAPRRAARLLAMDSRGRVDLDGTARKTWVRPDLLAPYGLRTSLRAFTLGGDAAFQVWVYGDLDRADRYAALCLPTMARQHRRIALERLDLLLATWFRQMPSDMRVLLLSPAPAASARPGDRLSPLLMFGEGVAPGLLTSGSTRRAGLVANTDFLPTVAAFFDLRLPAGMIGRPAQVIHGSAPSPKAWAAIHDRMEVRASQQAAFGGLPSLQLVLVLAALLLSLRPRSPLHPFTPSPLLILALPLVQLLLPRVSPAPVWQAALLLAGVLLLLAVFGMLRPQWATVMGACQAGGLVAAVTLDLIRDGPWLQDAWMSYSVMEGARYYGMGNEYAGAVFAAGMYLVAIAGWEGRTRMRLPALASLLLLAVLTGAPGGGANAGGFLGMMIGLGAAVLAGSNRRLRARRAAAAALLLLVFALALVMLDMVRSGADQTHIGRLFSGGGSVWGIIARKAALNGWLLLHSPWSLCLPASAAGLWRLWHMPGSRLRQRVTVDPWARGAAVGMLAGAGGLLLLNDSGVVAAAEALLMTWAAAFLMAHGSERAQTAM